MEKVAHWVQTFFAQHTTIKQSKQIGNEFFSHHIDGEIFEALENDDLIELGVGSIGLRKKFLKEVKALMEKDEYHQVLF